MTDRFNSLTVVLERDIREDDAESLMEAIRHLRGVRSVAGNVGNIEEHVARARVLHDVKQRLWKEFWEETQ